MAWSKPLFIIPALIAGEDMSPGCGLTGLNTGLGTTAQFLFAKFKGTGQGGGTVTTTNQVVHCGHVMDPPIGIIGNNPKSGSGCEVIALGVAKVMAGGTLATGDLVGTNSAGRGVSKSQAFTGANYNEWIMGICIEGTAAGELATVLLRGGFPVA